MSKTLDEVKYIASIIYADEFKEVGLKKSMTTKEANQKIRETLGLKKRAGTRGANSVSGIMRGKDYTDEEKDKIKEFVKGLGTDKPAE